MWEGCGRIERRRDQCIARGPNRFNDSGRGIIIDSIIGEIILGVQDGINRETVETGGIGRAAGKEGIVEILQGLLRTCRQDSIILHQSIHKHDVMVMKRIDRHQPLCQTE